MPHRALILLLIVVITALFGWWLGQQFEPEKGITDGGGTLSDDSLKTNQAPNLDGLKSFNNAAKSHPEDLLASNPYSQEEIKGQIMQVADLYADAAKYPHYSQPILNPDTFEESKPFEDTEVDTPFPRKDQQEEPVRIQIATERFQYFEGETVVAKLTVLNVSADTFIAAKGVVAGVQGDTNLAAEFQQTGDGNEYFASFDTRLASPQSLSAELLLKVEVQVNEEPLFSTVGFRYQQADAKLIAVPWARPDGAFLNIALQYDVTKAGYYFSNAVLADQETGKPLIQLQTEGRMESGSGILTMRAHIQALRVAGSDGPYILRSIRSYRGAKQGETFDSPAANLQQSFALPGYRFEQYTDEDFVDPLAQERAEFLRELGDVDAQETN